jgi:hypothetical protein
MKETILKVRMRCPLPFPFEIKLGSAVSASAGALEACTNITETEPVLDIA